MNFFHRNALQGLELRTFIYIDLYHTPPPPFLVSLLSSLSYDMRGLGKNEDMDSLEKFTISADNRAAGGASRFGRRGPLHAGRTKGVPTAWSELRNAVPERIRVVQGPTLNGT